MSSNLKVNTDENHYLRLASEAVSRGEPISAIQLLIKASTKYPTSSRILNALGKLLLKTNRPVEAAAYFKKALSLNTIQDLPTDDDFDYLAEQAESLQEEEYRYDEPEGGEQLPIKRKTIKLKERSGGNATKKIIRIKKRIVIKPADETHEVALDQDDSIIDDESSTDVFESLNIIAEPEPEPEPEVIDSEDVNDVLDILDLDEDNLENDDLCYEEETNTDLEAFDIEVDRSETDKLPVSEGVDDDPEFDIYDFWDDAEEPEDEIDDESDLESGALDGELTLEERARQVAISLVDRVGWEKDDISFVTDVFIENGWKQARVALEREIILGATREELSLAFYIKCLWKECDRYWIYFPKLSSVQETTDAAYKNCSWKQALRLVRIFQCYPSEEELYNFIELEFDNWYENKYLRTKFRSYSNYLFKYRLNDFIDTIDISNPWEFGRATEIDGLESPKFSLVLSDEVMLLRECGIDVHGNFTPKSYYTSDKSFDRLDIFDKENKNKTNKVAS